MACRRPRSGEVATIAEELRRQATEPCSPRCGAPCATLPGVFDHDSSLLRSAPQTGAPRRHDGSSHTSAPHASAWRLMTLAHLFLIHRYKADAVHFIAPSADNQLQTEAMKARGIFSSVATEVGAIIVADVNKAGVNALLQPDSASFAGVVSG